VTGFSKGYAFVEYRSERDANLAWRVSEIARKIYSPISDLKTQKRVIMYLDSKSFIMLIATTEINN